MNDVSGIPQYPWDEGDTVFASALNGAIANMQRLSTVFVGDAPPAAGPGTLWWDSAGTGLYIRYNDGNSTQWVVAQNQNVGSGTFLPLTGGTVTGATTFTLDTTGPSSFVNAITVRRIQSGVVNTTGVGVSAYTTSDAATHTSDRPNNPMLANIATAIKYMPAGGLSAGQVLQDQWAYISQNNDASNQPSSIGGVLTNEYDLAANGADDASLRTGGVYVFTGVWPIGAPATGMPPEFGPPPSVGGLPTEVSSGISLTANPDVVLKRGFVPAVPYSTSLIECRLASQLTGTIQTTVAAGGTSLHVSNVVSYLSWGAGGSVVSSGNPMPVTIGANTYSVIGAAFDAPVAGVTTNRGTITVSSGIVGTDGASGNSVIAHTRTIWLADGQQVAYSTSGDEYIIGGGGALFLYALSFVQINAPELLVTGKLAVGAGLEVSGAVKLDTLPVNAANDAAAATAGVAVGGVYRNGSVLQIRVV